MKRIGVVCLALSLTFLLAGCHGSSTGSGGVSGVAGDTNAEDASEGADVASSGSDAGDASSLKAYDPCALITAADVEAAFGWPVQLKAGTNAPANVVGQRICVYEPAPGSAAPAEFMVQVDVTSEAAMAEGPKQGGVTAATQYENIKKAFDPQAITEVAGLGDAAWDGGCVLGPGGMHVLVRNKGVYFTLLSMYSSKGCPAEQAIWRALSEKLISRL